MDRSGDSAILDRLAETRLDFSPGDESVLELPPLQVRSWGVSDAGRVRQVNEDRFLITEFPLSAARRQGEHAAAIHLFAVADGMGGHAGGQRASSLALETLHNYLRESFRNVRELPHRGSDEILARLQAGVAAVDAQVHDEARQHAELHGMGCTLTAACLWQNELLIAQVGDSRCYLFRDGVLERLTSDQTMVAELLRAGVLNPAEAARHPWRHVITNAIGGTEPGGRPELERTAVRAGDLILLCSDGLTDMVADEEIVAEARAEADPESLCRRLVSRANDHGGRDNITVVAARILEPDA